MRDIPEALAAQLASGVTTLAHVWRIECRDGAVFRFTDHDRPLLFDCSTCEPAQGLAIGAIDKSLGLAIDSAGAMGALSADAVTEVELARGLWDGARVDVYRVDWATPSSFVHLFAGRIGEVKRGASAFEAELRGLQAPLNVAVGRVFSRFCDADLGDAPCGFDLSDPLFHGDGVVTAVLSATAFRASGLGAFVSDWFTRGRIVWGGGGESEVRVHRAEADGAVIETLEAPGLAVTVGAGFTIHSGCDKAHATCRDKFANLVNFRGFPHMPGNDAVQAGPSNTARLDGGSRFR
ncbi:MAG: DUF2163 domain-containing protein [Pseudomonadota bacterium]